MIIGSNSFWRILNGMISTFDQSAASIRSRASATQLFLKNEKESPGKEHACKTPTIRTSTATRAEFDPRLRIIPASVAIGVGYDYFI
jgi:hypothetical protein